MTPEERDRLNDYIRKVRTERGERIASYAVATAYEMGFRDDDLFVVRFYAITSDFPLISDSHKRDKECASIVGVAATFEDLMSKDGLSADAAIEELQRRMASVSPAVVEAFLKVQPLIQPVILVQGSDAKCVDGEGL